MIDEQFIYFEYWEILSSKCFEFIVLSMLVGDVFNLQPIHDAQFSNIFGGQAIAVKMYDEYSVSFMKIEYILW
jgi:hypothetical protein